MKEDEKGPRDYPPPRYGDKKDDERYVNPPYPGSSGPPSYWQPTLEKGRRYMGLPLWGWALIAVGILVMIVVSACWWSASFSDAPEQIKEFEDDVVIAVNGHFNYLLAESWHNGAEVELDVASGGGDRFDVYVMDAAQYENAYGRPANEMAFSAFYLAQNVTSLHDALDLPDESIQYFLVVDNWDIPILSDDAIPTGILKVHVALTVTSDSTSD